MTLYEIDNEIRTFLDSLMDAVDENGELVDIDPARLDELQAERERKLENIACYIKNLLAEADAIKAEEKALKERRERAENKADRLKRVLSESLLGSGENGFSTAKCAVSFRKSETVVISNQDLLDENYLAQEITYKPMKTEIKKAIKAGQEVRGAFLQENQNIQIK